MEDWIKITLIAINLFFNGCSKKIEVRYEKVFVKTKVPKLKVLKVIPSYQITDIIRLDNTYSKVNTEQLKLASKVSQSRARHNKFYEEQNIRFNKEFVNVPIRK